MNHPVWRRRLAMLTDREWTEPLPIYTYLIEHDEGLILLDCGETSKAGFFPWWHPFFRFAVDMNVEPRRRNRKPAARHGYRPRKGPDITRAVPSSPRSRGRPGGLQWHRDHRLRGELPGIEGFQRRNDGRRAVTVAVVVRPAAAPLHRPRGGRIRRIHPADR